LVVALATLAAISAGSAHGTVRRAEITAGIPGGPAGKVVYFENFENFVPADPLEGIQVGGAGVNYKGDAAADDESYIAAPNASGLDGNQAQDDDCNGWILSANGQIPSDYCFPGPAGATEVDPVVTTALGEFQGETAAAAAGNHALTDYEGGEPGPGVIVQTSPNSIPAIPGDLYEVVGDFATVNYQGQGTFLRRPNSPISTCDGNEPEISTYLLSGSASFQLLNDVNPCTAAGVKTLTVGGAPVSVVRLSKVIIWKGGSKMGLEEYDGSGSPGTDLATDDLEILNVTPAKKLSLTKTASAKKVMAGHNVTYTLTLKNSGKAAVSGIKLCDHLPSTLAYVASSPRGSPKGADICWSIAKLAVGGFKRFHLTANVMLTRGGKIVNHASASAAGVRAVYASAAIEAAALPITPCSVRAPRAVRHPDC
jgi:uncharacterized repeat protein (TIGR01451 family)